LFSDFFYRLGKEKIPGGVKHFENVEQPLVGCTRGWSTHFLVEVVSDIN
jgi:hypothetical protein